MAIVRVTDRKKSSLVAHCDCGLKIRVYVDGRFNGQSGALGKKFTLLADGLWICEGCGTMNSVKTVA